MIIERNVQCHSCKKHIQYYIHEKENIIGVELKCECGIKMKCVDFNNFISRWRVLE